MGCCTPSYLAPQFNLDVNIWRSENWAADPRPDPDIETKGKLMMFQNGINAATFVNFSGTTCRMLLFLPKLTDIKTGVLDGVTIGDVCEVPAGTGRWYRIAVFDDVNKGYPNEFRVAYIEQLSPWPNPAP